MNDSRHIRAWCTYDWANSVYSLVITSAIFPVYYQAVAVNDDGGDRINFLGLHIVNSVLYSYALSLSFLIVAALLPLLSGMADYMGRKKFFMRAFATIGSLSCMGLYFFTTHTLIWGVFCCMMASIGFSGSLVFYDAYLPEIVTPDKYDSVSAKGYSWGYYGSVILMVLCMLVIQFHDSLGIPNAALATRISFLLVGLWWIGFAQVTFSVLPDNPYNKHPGAHIYREGYLALVKVWKSLRNLPALRNFLFAYFFFNMGVQTVMYLAATFGEKELRLPELNLLVTVLLIQLVAAIGANVFAKFSERRGNKMALMVMIVIWIGVCFSAYFVTGAYGFYAIATVVGMVMGGIQSLSRATYSKLLPEDSTDHASYFSFYDVTYNICIVFGTFSYGLIEQITGSMRNSTLVLTVFFIIGFSILSTIKMDFRKRMGISTAGA